VRRPVLTALRIQRQIGHGDRDMGEEQSEFLELTRAAKSLRILVPLDSLGDVGIRLLPTKQEVAAILTTLGLPSDVPEGWSERAAVTKTRLQTAELVQASMVIRDLCRHEIRSGKRLSASENAVLQSCLDSVSSELALVLGLPQDEARTLILERAQSLA
jgi:RNA polymerase-interacting CarD/CdnL/TRCF family regulator